MKVKELIAQLLECDMDANVVINNNDISLVWNCPLENKVNITIDLKEEEEIDREEYEEAFANLMGDLDEMLDAMYINGAR